MDRRAFLFALVVGTAFWGYLLVPLKRVVLRDSVLEVSNHIRTVTVPLAQLSDVTQAVWFGTGRVTIEFVERTPFGYSVTFWPSVRRRLAFWKEDDFVTELRALSEAARTQGGCCLTWA